MLHLKYPRLTPIKDLLVEKFYPMKASAFRELLTDRLGSVNDARSTIIFMRKEKIIKSVGSTNSTMYEWLGCEVVKNPDLDGIIDLVCEVVENHELNPVDILKLTDTVKCRFGLQTKTITGFNRPKYQQIAGLFNTDNFPVQSSIFKRQIAKIKNCSYRTAVNVCMDLIEDGILERTGDGRGTYYNLVINE